jgi:RIO kinase 1
LTGRYCSYHNSGLYIIDVSQSVEHDHPHAFDFLRSDIRNVDEFFSRRGVATLGIKHTFDLVTSDDWGKGGEETIEDVSRDIERRLQLQVQDPSPSDGKGEDAAADAKTRADDRAEEDAVFAMSYIPRALNEVYDAERDVDKLMRGEGDELIYAGVTGIVTANRTRQPTNADDDEKTETRGKDLNGDELHASDDGGETTASDSDASESGTDEEEDAERDGDAKPKGHKFEDKDAKRVSVVAFIHSCIEMRS